MIKGALEYLLGLGQAEKHEISGQVLTDKRLHLVPQPTPESLQVRNLSGLVEYLRSNFDDQPPVLVHVASPTKVNVYSTFNRDMQRNLLITAIALLPEIPFERFMGVEEFNILLQSCFVSNEDREALLAVVGNIKEENVATIGDDGVTQQVTAKTGVATVAPVKVPNPVVLKPYRTFVEITQPESRFVFRMRSGPAAALFEADGGAWKLQAMDDIKAYLDDALDEQITAGKVTIIG